MKRRLNLRANLIGWGLALSMIALAVYTSLAGDRGPITSGPVPEQAGLNITHDEPTEAPDIEGAQEVG